MNTTKIKICGLFRKEDAEYVNTAKPDYAGFVFYPPSHRNIDYNTAKNLRCLIDKSIKTVGVFVDSPIELPVKLFNDGIIDIIQLHGKEDKNYINSIRKSVDKPCEIWKAFKIRSISDIAEAKKSTADKIILDNGYGTGKCFDWSLIGKIERDFILAGGIDTNNIAEAINKYKPFAVDISSGVETGKVKDREKIISAVKICKEI